MNTKLLYLALYKEEYLEIKFLRSNVSFIADAGKILAVAVWDRNYYLIEAENQPGVRKLIKK